MNEEEPEVEAVDEDAGKIVFLASFPPIQSAIKAGKDGLRIQLDISATQTPNAVGLLALQESLLRVTIEVVESRSFGETETQRGAAPSPTDLALSGL